tara:strand:+ start:1559 stop:2050 length:492 start_codon:yes stop_codon:yes gene_type:complete
MNNIGLPIRIRAAGDDDSAFIYSTWLKSYAGHNKNVPKRIIWEYEDEKVRDLLASSVTLVAVGDSIDSAGDIYSFMCGERSSSGLVIHYCYTKAPFRKFGIAKSLLETFEYNPGELITHSYRPYIAKDLRRRGYNLLFNPYLREPETRKKWSEFYESNKHSIK